MPDKKTQGEEIREQYRSRITGTVTPNINVYQFKALCAIATQLERIADFLRLPASKWSK